MLGNIVSKPVINASFIVGLLSLFFSLAVLAQSQSIRSTPQHLQFDSLSQPSVVPPIPRMKPTLNPDIPTMSTRKINRVGTSIVGARNSVSIKSTDAGIMHRSPPAGSIGSTGSCINCGVIDFIEILGQGEGLNAIAAGVVAGTIAREIGLRSNRLPYTGVGSGRGQQQHGHHVGITMQDGSQAIVVLPDASHFNRGDHVKLIDGVLVPYD